MKSMLETLTTPFLSLKALIPFAEKLSRITDV